MLREPTIPIFLWIATAILLHIFGVGGSERIVSHVEARRDLLRFVGAVVREAKFGAQEIEVALLDVPPGATEEPAPDDPPEAPPPPEEPPPEEPPLLPEPEPPPLPDQPPEDLAEAEPTSEPPKPPELVVSPNDRRVAVVQHVDDPDQEDNPDARFIGDQANHVDEETQASITALDRNDPLPSPGGAHEGPSLDPGDADETRVAQSEDAPGEAVPPDPEPRPAGEPAATGLPPPPPPPPAALARAARPPVAPVPGVSPRPAEDAVESSTELVGSERGTWSASSAAPARPRRLPPRAGREEWLGYGRQGTTASGVNLNLSREDATAVVGADQLALERRRDGERRRSEHRGSWSQMGLERWRASIENYVASVKPGNQTALNTARVPFAGYLNRIHLRIHPIFADSFLRSLDAMPASDPLNRPDLVTHLEIVVHRDDGHLVRMGVTKSSGVTAFDVGALESVNAAAPFGRPPAVIVSPDGNVYLHWEFHRNPIYACSTFNARPYLLKADPAPARPTVPPPRRPADAVRDERQGAASRPGGDASG